MSVCTQGKGTLEGSYGDVWGRDLTFYAIHNMFKECGVETLKHSKEKRNITNKNLPVPTFCSPPLVHSWRQMAAICYVLCPSGLKGRGDG